MRLADRQDGFAIEKTTCRGRAFLGEDVIRYTGFMGRTRSKTVAARYGKRYNVGAYEQPFSGVGMEFEPLGASTIDTGFVLHETGYWPTAHAWNFPKVFSPFWRVYYDYARAHGVQFGNERTLLGPDRVLIIPNHQRFDCFGDVPVPKLWFGFSCKQNVEPAQRMPIIVPVNDIILAYVTEFPSLFRGRSPSRRENIRRLSLSFLMYILNQPQIRWQESLPEVISAAVAAINARPADPWANPVLAKQAAMSTDGFIRAFRQWLHTTPAQYVRQVRIREACRILCEGDDSIERIAAGLGFADRFHFSRVFKRLTGVTPVLYRKRHKP